MKTEILLIDDDGVNNFINEKLISATLPGIPIKTFTKAEEALEYLRNTTFDKSTILLDINMPDLSGWDFLNEMAAHKPEIQGNLFLLSSSIDLSDKKKAEAHNLVKGYLEKPLKEDDIKKLLT